MHEDSFHRSLQAAFDRAFPPDLTQERAEELLAEHEANPREAWTFPEAPIPDAEFCTAVTYPGFPGNNSRPPEAEETCDEEAVEGEEYCERHLWMSDSWEEF